MREKIKAFFKSKAGMTYIELLVALSLLCLIMVSFTPMLLKSYETLYGAGELNEATYEGKQDIEQGLATRVVNEVAGLDVSFNTVNLSGNVDELMSKFYLGLRSVTSSTQFSLETLFYGGKGRLNVLSSSIMRDDYDAKEIVIQAEGVNISSIKPGSKADLTSSSQVGTAVVRVYMPDYVNGVAEDTGFRDLWVGKVAGTDVKKVNADGTFESVGSEGFPIDGDTVRIIITGVDVTTPVLKIVMWYVDENSKIQEISTIVHIEPATITIVGGTSGNAGAEGSVAYYTTAGVEVENTVSGYSETFKVESRKMTGGGYSTTSVPNPTFLNVQWVDNDAAKDLEPYYVITGDNGVIQRLFRTNSNAVGSDKITYNSISGNSLKGFSYSADGLTNYSFPTVWGGDKSHQFSYTTSTGSDTGESDYHRAAYSRGTWLTRDKTKDTGSGEDTEESHIGAPGVYGVQAQMAIYFNGFKMRTKDDERMRDGRRISYVILESGKPLRFLGYRDAGEGSSWGGFITPWEGTWNNDSDDNENDGVEFHHGAPTSKYGFDEDHPRVITYNRSGQTDQQYNWDEALAYLNLKSFTTVSGKHTAIASADDAGKDTSAVDYLKDNSNKNVSNIKITASYYNPVTNEMRYLGTATAYAYVQQTDNTGIRYEGSSKKTGKSNNAESYKFATLGLKIIPLGSVTGYLIEGSDFNGTTIYKYSTGRNDPSYEEAAPALYNYENAKYTQTYSGQSAEFYVARRANEYTKTVDNDLEFTLGYSSNREEVFANVTYGADKTEYHNSYERFFNHSHYTLSNPSHNIGSLDLFQAFTTGDVYRNSKFGAHYHVWFPGEFYNLTKTATKEGVTVAVGYTVSGSSYQWVDPDLSGNTSTALGSVYNDGVLAAVVNTGSADASFKNLLYYKDYETCATNNILSGDVGQVNNYGKFDNYKAYYNNYGTHARQSIRFQAVDITTLESQAADGTYAKHYMAFFGDNRGRLFYAHVGSAVGTGVNSETGEITGANIALVRGIKDLGVEPFGDDGGADYAQQIEIDIGDHFSEITSIYCQDNVIIVCGTEKDGSGVGVVFARLNDGAGVDRIEYFEIKNTGNYQINDTLVLNGYLYFVGKKDNKGFVLAAQYAQIEAYMNMTDEERAADVAGVEANGAHKDGANGFPDAWENANNAIKKSHECDLATVAHSIAGYA